MWQISCNAMTDYLFIICLLFDIICLTKKILFTLFCFVQESKLNVRNLPPSLWGFVCTVVKREPHPVGKDHSSPSSNQFFVNINTSCLSQKLALKLVGEWDANCKVLLIEVLYKCSQSTLYFRKVHKHVIVMCFSDKLQWSEHTVWSITVPCWAQSDIRLIISWLF